MHETHKDAKGSRKSLLSVNRMSHQDTEHRSSLRIAIAANRNPREMRMILTAVRDLAAVGPADLDKAFEWAGLRSTDSLGSARTS
jgi:hypothetical protein